MGDIWILIMIIGFTTSQSGGMEIRQEFFSQSFCEQAKIDIRTQLEKSNVPLLRSQGCYKK
jgi:hypothetical protein